MSRPARDLRRPRRARSGVLESLREGTTDLVQSVAAEVVPPIVDALDVDEIVQRLDIQAILDRVDIEALLDKVDINDVLARVDVDALLARTELASVISRSGSALVAQGLDVVRAQGVGVDAFVERWVSRLLRRREPMVVTGPSGR